MISDFMLSFGLTLCCIFILVILVRNYLNETIDLAGSLGWWTYILETAVILNESFLGTKRAETGKHVRSVSGEKKKKNWKCKPKICLAGNKAFVYICIFSSKFS